MDETSKTRARWGDLEYSVLRGAGIDIGCGIDPVFLQVRRFDKKDGDANYITKYISEQFDFVYASHCLEHMHRPREAILEWWQLVRPGGYLFFIVPDEDLYEQGVFPSRFNVDHKATFTLRDSPSWSSVSIHVRDLAGTIPGGELISAVVQDNNYERRLQRHGPDTAGVAGRGVAKIYRVLRNRGFPRVLAFDLWRAKSMATDQTLRPDTLAQIQCIVRKKDPAVGMGVRG